MTPAPEKKVGVRRYASVQRGNGHWSLRESAAGDWMLFSDHEAEVARLREMLVAIQSAAKDTRFPAAMTCGAIHLMAAQALSPNGGAR